MVQKKKKKHDWAALERHASYRTVNPSRIHSQILFTSSCLLAIATFVIAAMYGSPPLLFYTSMCVAGALLMVRDMWIHERRALFNAVIEGPSEKMRNWADKQTNIPRFATVPGLVTAVMFTIVGIIAFGYGLNALGLACAVASVLTPPYVHAAWIYTNRANIAEIEAYLQDRKTIGLS